MLPGPLRFHIVFLSPFEINHKQPSTERPNISEVEGWQAVVKSSSHLTSYSFSAESRDDALAQGPDLLLAGTINPYYALSPISRCVLRLCAVKIQCC